MQKRHSIEAIRRVFSTGDDPVLVTCDDFEDYVCKYRHPSNQAKELLASGFLHEWGIPTPEVCLVTVSREHVLEEFWKIGARPERFERECFGSKYLQHTIEVNNSITALGADPPEVRKIRNRRDFLKIGLFDLWMANEDRTGNNYNLLLVSHEPTQFYLYAIDHSACFNSTSPGQYPLRQLTEEDSVLCTDLCRLLYQHKPTLRRDAERVLVEFRNDVDACRKCASSIVNFVPPSWGIDPIVYSVFLEEQLFNPNWINETEETFRRYLQLLFR